MKKRNKLLYNKANLNRPNPPSKLKTKNLVEINDELHRVYNSGSQIKFETSMLRSGLCDYDVCTDLLKEL